MDFPGKGTGVGCHFLLQGIFLTQELNPGLLHCGQALYPLNHQGSPWIKPASLEIEGGFLTTEPPGKSPDSWFESWLFYKTNCAKIGIILTLHECA